MTVLRQLLRPKGFWTATETVTNTSDWPKRITTLRSADSGMRLATVWACVKARAEDLGALPIDVIERQGRKRIVKPTPTWLEKPNPETTPNELIAFTSASIDTDGNAFWWLLRDRLGRVQEVWVLPPSSVSVYRDKPPRDDPHRYMPKEYRVGNEDVPGNEILHIRGFSLPGRLRGLNPIQQHMHTLGLALAAEEYGEAFFTNGAVMSGVIESERDPGKEQVERMRASFANDHQGLRNAHKPGFLFGAKWTQLTIPNDSAQFLETRKYQREEICAIFRVPPHKAQILDRATFSNIEHQGIEWVTDGLIPPAARIESAVVHGGLLDRGDQMKINFRGLLRGDTPTRYAGYAIGRQWGWLSVNDIRELEDMDPTDNGDVYLEPLNMVPAGTQQPQVAAALRQANVRPELIAAVTGVQYPNEPVEADA